MLSLFGELFNKTTVQMEETNLEKLMKFMQKYWITDKSDDEQNY